MAAATFKWRRVLGLVALVLTVGLSTLAAIHYWNARPLPFDRVVWSADVEDIEDFRRHRMADWLVEERRLLGMSRAEAISMLGEPTVTSHFRDFDLVYVLGNERGWISIDSEWLLIRLDNTGHVSSAVIARD